MFVIFILIDMFIVIIRLTFFVNSVNISIKYFIFLYILNTFL